MPRQIKWPKAPFVTLGQAVATLQGKQVEYTETNAGSGPFVSVGRLHVGKENSKGKHQVYIVFKLYSENLDENFEHAVSLSQEHVESLEKLDFGKSKVHFRCRRLIKS